MRGTAQFKVTFWQMLCYSIFSISLFLQANQPYAGRACADGFSATGAPEIAIPVRVSAGTLADIRRKMPGYIEKLSAAQ